MKFTDEDYRGLVDRILAEPTPDPRAMMLLMQSYAYQALVRHGAIKPVTTLADGIEWPKPPDNLS
jgi:hypothetical protein